MFKNLSIYTIKNLPTLEALIEKFAAKQFTPCGPTQEQSSGWVPVRGNAHDALIESVSGKHLIAKFIVETKKVPSDAIDKLVNEVAAKIEESEGRKPGKKERRELKENAVLELLPNAFPKQKACYVWIDREAGTVALDASSQGVIDVAMTTLMECAENAVIGTLRTETNAETAMTAWLNDEDNQPADFSMDRELTLKAFDETKAVVKYKNHAVDTDEVRDHLKKGMAPVMMAMTYNSRVSFKLNDSLKLTAVKILDVAMLESKAEAEDAFDANAVIMTSELSSLIDGLVNALDGYEVVEAA